MFPHLFEPGQIGSMTVKNRLFLAPMVRNYADDQGCSTARYEAHIERIARGGVGAITLEASYVAPEGKGFVNQLGLHGDHVIAPLRRLTDAAHRHGARIGVQLYHAGRQTLSSITGHELVAPSAIPCPLEQEMPRMLTIEDISDIVGQFAAAARRAVQGGCDYVEIHAAHGYLIAQFLSGSSNRRTDQYGGPLENRMRFLLEIYSAVGAEIGSVPIIVRLSGDEGLPDGLTLKETVPISVTLERAGVDALHVSAGAYGSYVQGRMISPMSVPDAPLAPLAEAIRAAVKIPVIAVNKIRTPELAEDLLAYGVADFIALGRPLLADPDWPQKASAGRLADINRCIACQEGCISRLFAQKDVGCLVNPQAGHEAEFSRADPAERRRVMVVGGGPGGMMAALMADAAGHEVSLHERAPRLGGQLFDAEAEPHRPGWSELRRYLAYRLRSSGVAIWLGSDVTAELIASEAPDVLILATGSKPRAAKWPLSPRLHMLTERDLLEGRGVATGQVVIAGGGCSGAQTAELLAEAGCIVTVVDRKDAIALDAPLDERAMLLTRLQRLGVTLMTGATIIEARDCEMIVDTADGRVTLPVQTLVLCHGSEPDTALASSLGAMAARVIAIGDCVTPRRVIDAIFEGARAGWDLGERDDDRASPLRSAPLETASV